MDDIIEENKLLKKRIDELRLLLNTIESNINEIKRKNEYTQMVIALNDISICLSLGYKNKNESFKFLNEDARVHGHYIDNLNDSGELKRAKMTVLYQKIKYMDNSIYEKINEIYPNVISTILIELVHVNLINLKVSKEVMNRVNEWWK
jgi:chromosome segregation ATPase